MSLKNTARKISRGVEDTPMQIRVKPIPVGGGGSPHPQNF